MKISVITVCYNAESTIVRAIDSFLEQDYVDRELIVIDGASTDRTCEIVRSYEDKRITFSSEPDHGIYDAMNKGLSRVTGTAFGCLNSDDRYHSKKSLSLIATALENSDIVSGRLHFVKDHDGSASVRIWQPKRFHKGAYKWGFTLPHPTTYAHRAVLDRVGPFVTNLRSASDYDWFIRALELEGFSHDVIEMVLVDMKIGGESTRGIRAIFNNSFEMLAVRRNRLGSGVIDAALFLNLFRKAGQIALPRLFRQS